MYIYIIMNYIDFDIKDHGFDLAMEPREGICLHVCYFNDECYAIDFTGALSQDLTEEMLACYLADYAKETDEDHSVKFTEVWYELIAGEWVEIKRTETAYSDKLIRFFMGLDRDEDTIPRDHPHESIEDLPF